MGVRDMIDVNVPVSSYAWPGGFDGRDMPEVGHPGLTDTELRSHFVLWP
jgi:alpha-galactosidase